MGENLTIKGKILAFLDYKGIKKVDFFDATGIKDSNFKGKNLQSQPGGDMIVKILTTYPDLSADWLLMSKGPMLKTKGSAKPNIAEKETITHLKSTNNKIDNQENPKKNSTQSRIPLSESTQPMPPAAKHTSDLSKGIPLIPFDAMAGALTCEQTALDYECERYIVPMFKGADFLIPVKGSSMYPKYNSGDVVACRCVPMTDLFFQWNKVYVIDTTQGALIKRIKPGSDKEHLLIVSDNESYDPFELPVQSINAIALVIGVIRLE